MIVYRTENKVNGKFYYGVTNGNNTKYLGSGKILNAAIEKYGEENFIRRTIMEFDTAEEAYEFEALIVDQDLVDRDDCYNIKLGGYGGWTTFHSFLGKEHTEESKKKMSDSLKSNTIISNGTFKGKSHSKESKKKMSKNRKGRFTSGDNSRAVRVTVYGQEYDTIKEAMEATGHSFYKIKQLTAK